MLFVNPEKGETEKKTHREKVKTCALSHGKKGKAIKALKDSFEIFSPQSFCGGGVTTSERFRMKNARQGLSLSIKFFNFYQFFIDLCIFLSIK
jgi:hypothetical protein